MVRRPVPEAARLRVSCNSLRTAERYFSARTDRTTYLGPIPRRVPLVASYVALLRGINVGGRNKVPMAQLRSLFESLGYTDVQTLIQSGNVVFAARGTPKTAVLETAIEKEFGFPVGVMVRAGRELRSTLENNPFPKAAPNTLHVGFLARKPTAALVKQLDAERYLPDRFAIRNADIYYVLPSGMGRSKLPGYVDRQLKAPITVRNWNTITKLVELAS